MCNLNISTKCRIVFTTEILLIIDLYSYSVFLSRQCSVEFAVNNSDLCRGLNLFLVYNFLNQFDLHFLLFQIINIRQSNWFEKIKPR